MTPPEEPLPVLGVPCMNSGGGGGINPAVFGGSSLGINSCSDSNPSLQVPTGGGGGNQRGGGGDDGPSSSSAGPSPRHHLQGTIV